MKAIFVVIAMAIGLFYTNGLSAQNVDSSRLQKIEGNIDKKEKKEARLEKKLEKKQKKLEKRHKKLERQERKVRREEKKREKEEKRLRKQQEKINDGAGSATQTTIRSFHLNNRETISR